MTKSSDFSWTPSLVERAQSLYKIHPAEKVAEILEKEFNHSLSRSSIIGIIHRTRIKNGHVPKQRKRVLDYAPYLPGPITKSTEADTKTFYKREKTCKFILPDNSSCSLPSTGSWCEEHKKIVFVPPKIL